MSTCTLRVVCDTLQRLPVVAIDQCSVQHVQLTMVQLFFFAAVAAALSRKPKGPYA
jgi:hypothetical protein